jgi:hypothetical protein
MLDALASLAQRELMNMANILRISLLGQLPNGEEWSVNPCFQIDGGSAVTATQAQAVANAVAAITMPTGITNLWSTSTSWTGCRVEARKFNGDLEALAEASRGGGPRVGTGPGTHPFQTATVLSLRTSLPGASGRGRLYFPATGVALSTTLRLSTADVTSHLSGAGTLMSAMNTAVRATFPGAIGLSVWSRKNLAAQVCFTLQMGDVLDTQRRRRDTLVEAYQTTTIP